MHDSHDTEAVVHFFTPERGASVKRYVGSAYEVADELNRLFYLLECVDGYVIAYEIKSVGHVLTYENAMRCDDLRDEHAPKRSLQ